MPESKRITVPYKELVEWVIKKNSVHEGIWGVHVRFGLQVINAPVALDEHTPVARPSAVIPLLEIGIQEYTELGDLSWDAAVINPRGRGAKKATSKKKAK